MTLVIAQKTDNGIISLSDTKLTFTDGHSENPYFGALKSHIIAPQISLHFAGDVCWAEKALTRIGDCFPELSHDDFADVAAMLLSVHIECGEKTDFILVNSQSSTICKISGGESQDCERAYIGDANAYRRFTDFLTIELEKLKQNIEEKYLMSSALGQAFESTLRDASLKTVDGHSVVIIQFGQHFGYQPKITVRFGPQKLRLGKGLTKVPFGSTEAGSFSENILTPAPGDMPQALGVHFHFGDLGVLWGPGHYIEPIIISDCTCDDLIARAQEEFGATIEPAARIQ